MKRWKRLLAVCLSATMVAGVLPHMALKSQAEEAPTTYYVAATSGLDTNAGTTENTALKTMEAALGKIAAANLPGMKIVLVEDYTTNNFTFNSKSWTQMVTIEGKNGSESLTFTRMDFRGPVTFRNIKLSTSSEYNVVAALGNEFVLGDGVTGSEFRMLTGSNGGAFNYAGHAQNNAYSQPHKVTINSGNIWDIYMSESGNIQPTVPGSTVTMNGGAVRMVIFGSQNQVATYSDDMNFVMNGGSIRNDFRLTNVSFTNGAALQMIFNNGVSMANNMFTVGFSPEGDTNATDAEIKAAVLAKGAELYRIYSAEATDGSILEPTKTAGTYQVAKGSMIAVAVNAETGEVANSVNGTLTVPRPGKYNVTWLAADTPTTYYVGGTNASDSNNGITEGTAFATVKKALTAISANNLSGSEIVVLGDTSVGSAGMAQYNSAGHKTMVVIRGKTGSETLSFSHEVPIYGPVTFQNIKLSLSSSSQQIQAMGNDIVFGENVTVTGSGSMRLVSGTRNGAYAYTGHGNAVNNVVEYSQAHRVTLNSGSYWEVFLGETERTTATKIPGATLTVNGENTAITMVRFANSGTATITYTDDVNVVMNGGKITNSIGFGGTVAFENGAALQLIFNNNTINNVSWGFEGQYAAAGISKENLTTRGGKLYQLNCQTGGTLSPTETAGTYQVNGNLTAVATAVDGSGESVESVNGLLTVPSEGIYNVTWVKMRDPITVYVSATGDDARDGLTAENAVKTLDQAVTLLSETDGIKTIKIVGTVDLAMQAETAYTDMITITGDETGSSVLKVSGFTLHGPLKLNNIAIQVTSASAAIVTRGNELIFGEGITKSGSHAISGQFGTGYIYNASTPHEQVTIGSGEYGILYLGAYNNHGSENLTSGLTEGADLTVNGGHISDLRIWATGYGDYTRGVTFTENVNITFNGGSFDKISTYDEARPTKFNKAFQLILNDGISGIVPEAGEVTTDGGYWLMKAEKGIVLTATATAGVFDVTAGEKVIAMDENGNYYVSDQNHTLTVSNAGVYSVVLYDEEHPYINTGREIIVFDKTTIDLSQEDGKKQDNRIFVGWEGAGNVAGNTEAQFEKNTRLTARYEEYNKDEDLMLAGQLKRVDDVSTDTQTLRFHTQVSQTLLDTLDTYGEGAYGGVVCIKAELLGAEDLTKGTMGVTSGLQLSSDTEYTFYKADIAGIKKGNACRELYTAKSYITYKDLNGFERTAYMDSMTTSVNKVAQKVLEHVGGATIVEEGYGEYFQILASEQEQYINYRSGLKNTYSKLTDGEDVKIVYFGGSVTDGYGVEKPEKTSWRAMIGQWIVDTFPNSNISNINKATGESGTYLGAYRVQRDIIDEEPDLLFVEYSINDFYFASGYNQAKSQFETIVREVKQALPNCDIVTVLVTEKQFVSANQEGNLHSEAQAHEDVSIAYNIPSIHVGRALSDEVNATSPWSNFSIDIVHLNEAGNRVYYSVIEEFMRNSLCATDYDKVTASIVPEEIVSDVLFDGNRKLVQPTQVLLNNSEASGGTGFTYNSGLYGLYDYYGYIETSTAGSIFAYEFEGTDLAILSTNVKEGQLLVSIDGGEYQTVTGSGNDLAKNPRVIIDNIVSGKHTVKIKNATGDVLKIGAIFTRDRAKETKKATSN